MALPCHNGGGRAGGADDERRLPEWGGFFAALGRPRPCLLVAPGLFCPEPAGVPCLSHLFRRGTPMSSYPTIPEQPTFSLLSRCFAFRQGARFTGLLEPSFFQGVADEHRLHFGSGPTDT